MKKLVLFLSVCALLASAVWVGAAGDAGDPLASLSYLNGEFSQRAEKKIDQALEQSDKELAERLKNGEVGEAAATWQETRLKEGDTLHGVTGTGVVLSAIIGVVTVLTGSGVAAFTSLAHVIPDVAQHLNSNGIAIMLMMHTASEMLRALSPVAGVIIIVAGFAKVSPFAIIKRTAIPCVVGYITMLIIVSAIF